MPDGSSEDKPFIFPNSSDLKYLRKDIAEEDVWEMGSLLGVDNLREVTKFCLKPERVLYHACLNGVQRYMRVKGNTEEVRSQFIKEKADAIYDALIGQFSEALLTRETSDLIHGVKSTAITKLETSIKAKKLSDITQPFYQFSDADDWEDQMMPVYKRILESLPQTGFPEEKASSLTKKWLALNTTYSTERKIARKMVRQYMGELRNKGLIEDFVSLRNPEDRVITMVIGAPGVGKTVFSQKLLDSNPDVALMDADYLKPALFERAKNDGVYPADTEYNPTLVHNESSHTLHTAIHRSIYVAQKDAIKVPHLIINKTKLTDWNLREGSKQSKIIIHHLLMPTDDTIAAVANRRNNGGRGVDEGYIRDMIWESANSLLQLTKRDYAGLTAGQGRNIEVHLHSRPFQQDFNQASAGFDEYASFNCKNRSFIIRDINKIQELADVISPQITDHNQRLSIFLNKFIEAGFSLYFLARDGDDKSKIVLSISKHRVQQLQGSDIARALNVNESTATFLQSFRRTPRQNVGSIKYTNTPDLMP